MYYSFDMMARAQWVFGKDAPAPSPVANQRSIAEFLQFCAIFVNPWVSSRVIDLRASSWEGRSVCRCADKERSKGVDHQG